MLLVLGWICLQFYTTITLSGTQTRVIYNNYYRNLQLYQEISVIASIIFVVYITIFKILLEAGVLNLESEMYHMCSNT